MRMPLRIFEKIQLNKEELIQPTLQGREKPTPKST
jgi:hypothetical protein